MPGAYSQKPLIKVMCPEERDDGFICGRYLGDIAAEEGTDQGLSPCHNCGTEWLARLEGQSIIMQRIPRSLKKNYVQEELYRVVEGSDAE
jgi:hypothetical protein